VTETNNQESKITILLSIFFISISLFVYQVVLTRVYSAIFSYHYVFLITSFAILGLGIGSIITYKLRARDNGKDFMSTNKRQKKKSISKDNIKNQINKGSIILAISYIAVFILSYAIPFVNSTLLYIILGTIPFIIGGYLFSVLFTEFTEISGKLYFADLIGSGMGSIVVIYLINNAGMFKTIVLVSIIALIPSLIVQASMVKMRVVGYILSIVFIASLLMPGQYVNSIEQNFVGIINNTSKTYGNMKRSGMSPEIIYSKWNAFSRTDVIKLPESPDEMILTIDGSANAPMFKFDGQVESLDEFKKDTGFLPFMLGNNEKTLLIGPGGGRDVLYALAGGSTDITAVEINTSSIDAVKSMGAYNGNIYNRPEVKVYGEDGRSFVRRTQDKFDLIFLSLVMTNTSQGMGYALSENYIYTVEAMEDYLEHLNDKGKVAFLAHDQDDLSKIVATALTALENKGIPIKEAPKHIALYTRYMSMGNGGVRVHNPVIIIKNKPFSEEESQGLLEIAQKNQIAPMYTPVVFEEGPLYHIEEAHISMADFLNAFSTNVTPAIDDSPYFYNFGKGIPSTLLLILLVVIIGSVILFAPFVVKAGNLKPSMYFSLLGVGFMMIEVPLIQKFTLYLGHPALAFTYVLAALLIGGGLGGYLSNNRLFNRTVKAVYLAPIMVVIVNMAILLSLNYIFKNTIEFDLSIRIVIASVLVMIQGFFMGMPFPRGLKLISERGRGEIVPVMWGINGVMSVIGSVLSIILSMLYGFSGAMVAGAIIYLVVSFFKTL